MAPKKSPKPKAEPKPKSKASPKPKAKASKRPANDTPEGSPEPKVPKTETETPVTNNPTTTSSVTSASDPLGLSALFSGAEDWGQLLIPVISSQPEAATYIGPKRDKNIVPVRELTFQALKPNAPKDWKVIIFGQNPYPRVESATGIAMFDNTFHSWEDKRFGQVVSMRCIMKAACMMKYGLTASSTVNDVRATIKQNKIVPPPEWFQAMLTQGVLLLNASLTVSTDQALTNASHTKFWRPIIEALTKEILKAKSESGKGVVFAWWGESSKALRRAVEKLQSDYPSVKVEHIDHYNPAAQGDGFCYGDPFGKINKALTSLGQQEIDWAPTVGWDSSITRVGSRADPNKMKEFIAQTVELHKFYMDRLSSVGDETGVSLAPITGISSFPLLPFEDAIKPVCDALGEPLKTPVAKSLWFAGKKDYPLVKEEVASLFLYTTQSPFYKALNAVLRDPNRDLVKPYYGFLKLFLLSLTHLPPFKDSLWRGVGLDMRDQYPKGSTVTWWGVSSCTPKRSVAEGFLTKTGHCMLFEVISKTAVSIKEYSAFTEEDEYVLAPGTQLKVTKTQTKGNLTTVTLEEVTGSKLVS